MLAPAYGYDTNVERYLEFLTTGSNNF